MRSSSKSAKRRPDVPANDSWPFCVCDLLSHELQGARPIGAPVMGGTSGNVDLLQAMAVAIPPEFRDFQGCKRAYVTRK